jgi:hypothetical protein
MIEKSFFELFLMNLYFQNGTICKHNRIEKISA